MKWVKYQLNEEQAHALYKITTKDNWPPERIVRFQLFQNRFICDIEHYLKCLRKVFGYGHFNSMFDREERTNMIRDYLKTHEPPTTEEIKELLGDKAHLIGL